jgi:hypothetical protein
LQVVTERVQVSDTCGVTGYHSSLVSQNRPLTSPLFILEPKYLACRPAGDTPPPLGAILVADISGERGVVAVVEAAARVATEPWCPVVLVSRSTGLDHTVKAVIDQLGMVPAILTLPGEANLLAPDTILTAVNAREKPTSDRLAGYVVSRTERPEVRLPLEECFRRGMSDESELESYSRSTLGRRLGRFGPLKPHDWTGLARALSLMLDSGAPGGLPRGALVRLSQAYSIDPRTVQAHIHRFTGLTFEQARERPGWEWVIEAGLRRAGYLGRGLQQDATRRIGRSG